MWDSATGTMEASGGSDGAAADDTAVGLWMERMSWSSSDGERAFGVEAPEAGGGGGGGCGGSDMTEAVMGVGPRPARVSANAFLRDGGDFR